jgi:large subunit ribosomal protein L21
MEYAVIRTGGKQYRVSPGQILHVEKVAGEPGAEVEFTDVLLTANEGTVLVGSPTVAGARVKAQVVSQRRDKKILIFKKKRRKNYRRRQGHRQYITTVRVTGIESGATAHGS